MITSFEQINDYPEYPKQEIINIFVDFVIANSIDEPLNKTLEKLEELADKQYHLYQEPKKKIKEKLKNWIVANWNSASDELLESIMCVLSGFAMKKELYQIALDNYNGEDKSDFEKILINSSEENINPWWDLKKKSK
jgi:hypothetical protein